MLHRNLAPRASEAPRHGSAGSTLLAGAALLGIGAYVWYRMNRGGSRDSAPGYTARRGRFGDYTVVGRAVTINRDRQSLYDHWRRFESLPHFMENVLEVRPLCDGVTEWRIAAPNGDVRAVTRIVSDRPGEEIAWRSTEDSEIDTEGKVTFREAPAGRGTVVEARIAYRQPGGVLGRGIAFLAQTEPRQQARRDLKRFKMLMETGEITSSGLR